MINFMSNLKVWVSQFRVEESQTSHRPRHIHLHLLLTLQRVRDVRTEANQVAVGQIVADVPVTVTTVLDAHVAQDAVKVPHRHVECLCPCRARCS